MSRDHEPSQLIQIVDKRAGAASAAVAAVRSKLAASGGRQLWRSLDELADTPEFHDYLKSEFPRQAPAEWQGVQRRDFLKLMGASLALAGLSGCAYQPAEHIVPYVKQPEDLIPGKPLFFATAVPLGGYVNGVLAESHMGRPTKIEGNPDHPASLGATDPFMQAAVLSLWDPDRSQNVLQQGAITTWEAFQGDMMRRVEKLRQTRGAGFRILTQSISSPTLLSQLQALQKTLPEARWHQYEPVSRDNIRDGAMQAFGQDVNPVYHFEKADVVVSLDNDFLFEEPGHVRYARDFMSGRRTRQGVTKINRLYIAESTFTITGAVADNRVAVKASEVEAVARAIAGQLGVPGMAATSSAASAWVSLVVKDLSASRGRSLVVVGLQQPAAVHALAHALNHALGNVGATVEYTAPVLAAPPGDGSIQALASDMKAGKVSTLLILGGNPVYDAPADLEFSRLLDPRTLHARPYCIHVGHYSDETSELCEWHVPETHFLETWSDGRSYDGTATIMQPLIDPLYDPTHSVHEVLAVFNGQPQAPYDLVRGYWMTQPSLAGPNFEKTWRKVVHDGVVPGTRARTLSVPAPRPLPAAAPAASQGGLEITFRPDQSIWDGRFGNNAWLQELPRTMSKITWGNAALVSPTTAVKLKLNTTGEDGGDINGILDSNGTVVELTLNGVKITAPMWILPGQPDDSITVHLGYGRQRGGSLASDAGFDVYPLRSSQAMWMAQGVEVRLTGEQVTLATTQHHHSMEGRNFVRSRNFDEFTQNPDFAHAESQGEGHESEKQEEAGGELGTKRVKEYPGMFPEAPYTGYAWGMAIDLNTCIGCNACTIACQAENNIATVGRDMVIRGREMHWIRVDRYFEGDMHQPEAHFQPIPCMHCEKAPCEPVCPVEATSHSVEGLNEMTYNRCIGTKYCSNNCPYKVRRFNFLQFSDQETPTIKLMKNPDVTVRSRGVMEKCTYCVQRITEARIASEREDRLIREGDIVTACQQVCPTEAIVFGDINDNQSKVSKLKDQSLNYGLLTELNTQPRTTYLAKVKNRNQGLIVPKSPGREG